MKVVPGYLSPPIATPSYTPSVDLETMLFNSLDIPPDLDTYATLPGLYSFECKILSIIPPVLPILKHPGLTPPTVAGPIIDTFFSLASLMSLRV
jgi:hypothetical protein